MVFCIRWPENKQFKERIIDRHIIKKMTTVFELERIWIDLVSECASCGPIARALDKREYLMINKDNFCEFCRKTYVVTSHLNRLIKTVKMKGINIWFP